MKPLEDKPLKQYVRSIPDFPKPGIIFRDITTLIEDGPAFRRTIDEMAAAAKDLGPIDKIVAPEARGFIFGAPLAAALGIGLVLVRKPGKLPGPTESISYQLEYGEDTLQIHRGSILPNDRVLIVDDLLATGGTIAAVRRLVESLGATALGAQFVIELPALAGRARLEGLGIFSVMSFDGE